MKRTVVIAILWACIFASIHVPVPAYAGSGTSCSDPMKLIPNFEQTIVAPDSFWYVANTFDLPLSIDFYPASSMTEDIALWLDFSCTPGVYDDPILDKLFGKSHSSYYSMPYRQMVSISADASGKPRYHVAFGEFYRNMLLLQGIDYNLEVYIRVEFPCGGWLTMTPDPFNYCMGDDAPFMHLGDSVFVDADDKQSHIIVPYVQWQYDSIQYEWHGEEECIFGVSSQCLFDPTDGNDTRIINGGPDHPIPPGGTFKVTSRQLMDYVNNPPKYPNDAGMYFAKFYSHSPGYIKIVQIPSTPPQGEAEVLKYGIQTEVHANDTAHLYAIPDSWIQPMQFTTPTDRIFRMYVGTTADFEPHQAIATYQFDRAEEGHTLSLFEQDLNALWAQKDPATPYLYIRFACSEDTYVLPTLWSPSDCAEKVRTNRIEPGVQFEVAKKSKDIYYLYYEDWKNGDLTLSWAGINKTCLALFSGECTIPKEVDESVIDWVTVPVNDSIVYPQDQIDAWAPYVDPDGYIYARFYAEEKAMLTLSTTSPQEEESTCPPPVDSIQQATAWDQYTWRGETFTRSDTYRRDGTIDPETGCMDSVFTLNLTIHTTSYDTYEDEGCGSVMYKEQIYTTDSVFNDTIPDAEGNRTVMTVRLKVFEPHPDTDSTAVVWDSIAWYGSTYTQSDDYTVNKQDSNGCDYTHTLHLTVHHTAYDTYEDSGCDSVVYNGITYRTYYEFRDTIRDDDGNRTVVAVRLTVLHSSKGSWTEKTCEQFVAPSGRIITQSGDYQDTIFNTAGCDSIIALHLTIRPSCDTIYKEFYLCTNAGVREEEIEEGLIYRYIPYQYVSPATWDYMEGVIEEENKEGAWMNLAKAEQNLLNFYQDGMTPVTAIVWTYCPAGAQVYSILPVEPDQPQWVAAGMVALQVQFLCGEMFYSSLTTDIDPVNQQTVSNSQKLLVNGQLLIRIGDKIYNVQGQEVKSSQ